MEMVSVEQWQRPEGVSDRKIRDQVRELLAKVEANGDPALQGYSQQFDGFAPSIETLDSWDSYPLEDEVKDALATAAERIRKFAQAQRAMYRDVSYEDGWGTFGHRIVPIDSVAAYIPGGRFPLVSTALMTLIPAAVAGVDRRWAFSPSNHPALKAAASLAGAQGFVHIGGAQAVAAATFGYADLKPFDMVVGPGNAYVNAAKALVQDRIKIDTLAGPSEILILTDGKVDPEWIALDILSQAEHDPMALSLLASTDREFLVQVARIIEIRAGERSEFALGHLQLVEAENTGQLVDLSNRMAPEHLMVVHADFPVGSLRHYGSLFHGPYAAVALGDYITGPNHTLPTLEYARVKGGLQVGDFLKILTHQSVHQQGYAEAGRKAAVLADLEGLYFHAQSLKARL